MFTACSPFSVNVGVGAAYVVNVPEKRLTGHEQFHVSVELEKPITDNLSVVTGWEHTSNGAHLGIGRFPNRGLDMIGTKFEYKFQF